MQTPKTRTESSKVPQRSSHATPCSTKQQKASGANTESASSPATRAPKARSPKIVNCRAPRIPASEQKQRPGRISYLEDQLAQLQKELKEAHDQLSSSESVKNQVYLDNEDAYKQLAAMSAKLEESEQQVQELSASEDSCIQELRKISQDRDRAWQYELEAVQKHHSLDSAALVTAMNDIQKLKMQLERVVESEAGHARREESEHAEVQSLKQELSETLHLIENLKKKLINCKESKTQALEAVRGTEMRLGMAKSTEDTLRSECLKVMEAYNSVAVELDQSKNQIIHLEGLLSKLQADISSDSSKNAANNVDSEVARLRSALEAAERRYEEEYVESTLQIKSAYEVAEYTKLKSRKCEAELEANLMTAKSDIEELRSRLMNKETDFHVVSEENQCLYLKVMESQLSGRETELELELKKIEEDMVELKANLLDKETTLQSTTEENKALKIGKEELENNEVNDETLKFAEAARYAEREALMKLTYLTEKADKSSKRIARATEQLDAAQTANSEMEAELRKLKVQCEQWRKAAEAAAAMLTSHNRQQ